MTFARPCSSTPPTPATPPPTSHRTAAQEDEGKEQAQETEEQDGGEEPDAPPRPVPLGVNDVDTAAGAAPGDGADRQEEHGSSEAHFE
eukprot:CAMPEP_0172530434 /NCGR_PEP_ID=MMETSP1067-20121228/4170_1 /TAXON_ID=265564 ORGANISM="Thalassiosira punctigera, Strain Tpunct2005C2" /NCGR_SAMPLE_ID=MMETSP1067 /ASSEMBLY_ACC=CAM_ASM_000444 /LENGTH=87 /DNA_ID=CAMNT_0013314641 /DNA_START=293 /DNA_END=557 /DNA_ORIENTATION=-